MFFPAHSDDQNTRLIVRDGAGEMVQWVEVAAAKPDDLSLIPRTHLLLHMRVYTYTHAKIMKCD